jgi:hypothetical protein
VVLDEGKKICGGPPKNPTIYLGLRSLFEYNVPVGFVGKGWIFEEIYAQSPAERMTKAPQYALPKFNFVSSCAQRPAALGFALVGSGRSFSLCPTVGDQRQRA